MLSKENLPFRHDIEEICPALLDAFNAFEKALRWFDPGMLSFLREKLRPFAVRLESVERRLNLIDPKGEHPAVGQFREATSLVCEALRLFAAPVGIQESIMQMLKARRKICRAQEILYSLRGLSWRVNSYFLEEPLRGRLGELDPESPARGNVGIHHVGQDENPYVRGTFSLYVPESYDGFGAWPLVIALHGGFGHGRDFLWTWLREARGRRFLLLSPTSTGATWSLTGDDVDWDLLQRALKYTMTNWSVDAGRLLLTGISDGGTYALRCGLRQETPFTVLAPFSCTLPAFNLRHAPERRIMWVHGTLDWMFSVDLARKYAAMLKDAGAEVIFREIGNLSHTYAREAHDSVLAWFDPACALSLPEEGDAAGQSAPSA